MNLIVVFITVFRTIVFGLDYLKGMNSHSDLTQQNDSYSYNYNIIRLLLKLATDNNNYKEVEIITSFIL